ncbi:hypothetical protein OKA05_21310 [Luteolibacter arcticus]|uniref:Uncharacterized protein n=1 Tax=Luteolibacter arcticus TaxID=1581411 RepID=A0ABT3GNM0_9BACT|nr:hypothetical protein [Luteolibacter arcticus]MCW1925114.1 hypothetical protein [Luteolibacter arcticus]
MNPGLAILHAADGFAMAMVVILIFSLGIVGLLAAGIYRSGKRRENEVEKLLEELRREEEEEQQKHPAPPAGANETRDPWEKDPDWWQK